MHKINKILMLASIFLIASATLFASPQEPAIADDDLTLEKRRILILPAEMPPDSVDYPIEEEVTGVVASIAVDLGRFEVIDRNNLRATLQEQDLVLLGLIDDSVAVELGKIVAAREALLIRVLNFDQRGVPKKDDSDDDDDDDESFGSILAKGLAKVAVAAALNKVSGPNAPEAEPFSDNIQTSIQVEVRNIDVETTETLYSFRADGLHTGGGRGKSRQAAMRGLARAIRAELRKFYLLESQVVDVHGREALLLLGTSMGIHEGMIFQVLSPDEEINYGGRTVKIPGRPAGYAMIRDLADETSRALILRQWGHIESGYHVTEQIRSIHAFQIFGMPSIESNYISLGFRLHFQALKPGDAGLAIKFQRAIDKSGKVAGGIGIQILAGRRISFLRNFSLTPNLIGDGELFFRTDDENHTVNARLLSIGIGVEAEVLLSEGTDFVIGAGYRFGGTTNRWTYSEGEGDDSETIDATWNTAAPEITNSGLFLTLGLKFYFRGFSASPSGGFSIPRPPFMH